ncbi:hypothetical protein A3Q34_05920 [Colwellia sp. PAMC 20917]|nr:hypothetical protein A3Q34_05920 [Colwellia sp. PAMC 20917]
MNYPATFASLGSRGFLDRFDKTSIVMIDVFLYLLMLNNMKYRHLIIAVVADCRDSNKLGAG